MPNEVSEKDFQAWISEIKELPQKLRERTENLSEEQLDMPYRPGGWTLRQLIHHIADSHSHAFIRFKWTLTEEPPVKIKAYDQKAYAEQPESRNAPVTFALDQLTGLHARWVYLLEHLTEEDFKREFVHPETNKKLSLLTCVGMYAWHSRHHYAHLDNFIKRKRLS